MKDLSNENIIHIKKGNIQYLQFRKLLEYKDIINHAYGIGLDRNYRTSKSIGEEKYNKAVGDYKELCDAIGINYINCVKPCQEHTKNIRNVKQKMNRGQLDFEQEQYKSTDGLVTNQKNIALATIRGMDKLMVGSIGSAMTGNPVGAVSGSLGMVSELAKSEIGNLYDMEKTAMQMNNLENAPNQMKGGANNLFFENSIDQMKCYFEFWEASDLVKKSLLETFLEKGIYINRYMDPEEIEKYFTFNDTELDKQFKYIKGNFEFYDRDWENQMNLPYNMGVRRCR